MKKTLALLLIFVLVMSLAACSKKEDNKETTTPTAEATATAEPTKEEAAPTVTEEPTEAPTEEVTPEPTEEVTPEPTEEVTPEPTDEPVVTPDTANEDIFVKSEGVMTYMEYAEAQPDDPVVVETFVQDKQSWWEDKATIYTQDNEGAYFIYNMTCSQEDYDKLIPGQKIRVTGYKADFQGEEEIADATFEFLEGNYIASAFDVTPYLGSDAIINYQNMFVEFKGLTVAASKDADGNDVAFLYKWNGSGQEGDDLYFNVELNGNVYTFTVESYLRDQDSEVYQAVKNLNIGDKIDLTGYLYWYDTINPHIISVSAAQ